MVKSWVTFKRVSRSHHALKYPSMSVVNIAVDDVEKLVLINARLAAIA